MKVQQEMMKVQMQYASDPAKMQKEMERLSNRMNEISMQYASAMAGSYVIGQADIGNMVANAYADAEGSDEADEKAKADFVAANPVKADLEKYLPIGATLLTTQDEPWQCFAFMEEKEYWLEVLKQGWDIKKVADGRKMTESLLKGRHQAKFGEDYVKFKAGRSHKLDGDSVEGYNDNLATLATYVPALVPFAERCSTLLAWDLERAGYLSRIFHALGWIDQKEMADWLERTAKEIKANFNTWEEYIVSVLIGRAVAFRFDDAVVGAADYVLNEGKALLKKYPISRL